MKDSPTIFLLLASMLILTNSLWKRDLSELKIRWEPLIAWLYRELGKEAG
jgi:hypothetical protein